MKIFGRDLLKRKYDFIITPTLACPAFPVHTQGPEKIDGKMVDPFEWLHFTIWSLICNSK